MTKTRFAQAYQMYDRIPMKSATILPDEGFDARWVNVLDSRMESEGMKMLVYCLPKPNKGYAKHRVMVICDCGRHVPFGRMSQHYRKPTCN